MSDKESEIFLIERAKVEEEAHNWVEAAKQYEQAVEIYLQKNLADKVADGFKKIGFSYLRAVETADTEEGLFKRSENAIKAYEEASNLFKQRGDIAEELECRAEICYIKGFIASNAMEWKSEFNKSLELFTKSSKIYFKEEDLNSYLRTLSRAGMASFSLSQYLDTRKELLEIYNKGIEITEKAWELSIANENFHFISEIIYSMVNLNVIPIYITNFKKDKKYKEYMWKLNEKVDKSLTYLKDHKDSRSLALIYFAYAHVWCGYTTHYIEDEIERGKALEKGNSLFENAIKFSREASIKFILIFSFFWINWWMIYGQKYNYVQKRILNDINEVVKLGTIYKHSNIALYFFTSFLPSLYYANISNFRMFKLAQRKRYAEKGFEFAQECFKTGCLHPMIASTLYQVLTYSCSLLVNLSPTDIERNGQTQKMINYAEQANKIGEKLEGGLARAAGYSSLYRAYKTRANITEDDSFRIKMLQAAFTALENYLGHTIESVTARFIIELRLGLLLEEIGIATGNTESLLKSKELFLNVINEGIKQGYYQYVATGFVSVARIEDRLGNYLSSAEHYRKADDSYSNSITNIKYSLLKNRIRVKQSYAQAWSLIETAKLFHKREEHLKAKVNYERACQILEKIPTYNYEAIYYTAWTFLEEAEQLGKQEYHEEAIEYYTKTKENFNLAINKLEEAFEDIKEDRERERIEKLKKVAKVRNRYCSARINIEEARILSKKGDHLISAEKFSAAASQFKQVCNSYKIEREKKELEAVYYLCRAWENMEIAEQYLNPNRFAEASDLFLEASKRFTDSKMKLLSSGNSTFCQALNYGYKFDKSIDMTTKADLYSKVKILLREATNSYRKGNFESGAGWALATSIYFDAAWHIIKADVEMTLGGKKELLEVAAKLLRSASDLFVEAGYQYKQKEIKTTLEMLKKEEIILISAINTIKKPSISESTVGIIAPACSHESSQSPRISEVREYSDEMIKVEIREPSREKYQLIYKDLLKEYPENQQQEFRVGIAQIGLSSTDNILDEFYMDDGSGLLHLREDKVDTISEKVKDVINNAQKNEINILIFPEMSIDLTYERLIEEISNLAKKFNMYIIPGSYHELSTRRNLCMVISPDGVLWEQEKNIPAMINFKGTRFKEGIKTGRFPRKITICNTEYGRIAIAICRDFLDMDLRVELKNFEPPVDLIINPAFTPVTADFKAAHFDARRSIYAYCFFANIGEYGNSLIYTPEKERIERTLPPKEEGLIFKDIDLFKLRSERKKWQKIHEKEKKFIQSTR